MIIFAADQAAGAEYLVPLLQRWRRGGAPPWRLFAAPRSFAVFDRYAIEYDAVSDEVEAVVERALRDNNAQLVVFSASAGSALEIALRAGARQRDILSVQFIDVWANYSLRFRNGIDLDLPDVVLTIDSFAEAAMVGEGIPADIIEVIGQPYFEQCYQVAQAKPQSVYASGRGLLVTQPIARYFGRTLGYDEHDFLQSCLDAWQACHRPWDTLDIAVHPEEDRESYRHLLRRNAEGARLVSSSEIDLRNYAVVLGMYSSLLVQSVLLGVPTASVELGAGGPPMSYLAARGFIPRARHIAEIVQWLKVALSDAGQGTVKASSLLPAILGSCDRLERFLLARS